MKPRIIAIALMLSAFTLNAQEQAGVVKTIGRPGKPGTPIEDVSVRAKGSPAVSVSDAEGSFMITLAHYTDGQAYSLSRVFKPGYDLADEGIIGRSFPYSADIPLEISMISEEDYMRTKKEIEAQVRSRMEKEYQDQLKELNQQLEKKSISEEMLQKKHTELLDYYDNIENLVQELADRYARTDYDRLDSLDQQINQLIEQGRLEEAESLIEGKQTKQELEKIKASNAALAQALEEGKEAEAKKTAEYADELQKRFEIAAMRFDNKAAAGFLKQRMELDPLNVAWKLKYAIFICDYLGQYAEAMDIYHKLLENDHGTEVTADIYGCMGNVYEAQGKIDESLEACMTAAALREGDPSLMDDLATSYSNIAGCYIAKDQYKPGLEYLDKAMGLYHELQDSLGMTYAYSSIAIIQRAQGDFAGSRENLLKAIGIRERHLGETSLPVAAMYSNLAALEKETGHFSEAYRYLNKAIGINKKILGEYHPKIAGDYLFLGSLDQSTGNHENALTYYERALDILNNFHLGTHPTIAEAYNKIGYFHKNVTNQFTKAEEYYRISYEMLRDIYGDVHSDVAIALNNLASLHNENADYAKALEYYNKAKEISITLYGEASPLSGDIINNIAEVHYQLGDINTAKTYYEKAHEITSSYYGENHQNTGRSYNNLGGIYDKIGEDNKALACYTKACEIYESVYEGDHPDLANTYSMIGCLFVEHKMYDKAEEYLNEALRIAKNAYSEDHTSICIYLNNLSQVYQNKGNYAKAEEMLLQVNDILAKTYGEYHPKTATSVSNLSVLYLKKEEYDKALEYNLKSLAIVEKCYPAGHENIIVNKYGVANIYFKIGQYANAIPYMTSVHYDSLEKAGPDDRYTSHYFMYLHQMYMGLMNDPAYDGAYAEEFAVLNANTMITATVVKDSPAEMMGLTGTYQVMAYEEWTLADTKTNFFPFNISVAGRPQKTYILHRDGKFIKVPFEGKLGINLNPTWISAEEKEAIAKAFKKWHRKNR